jgi:hydrogenase maturation protein HypF
MEFQQTVETRVRGAVQGVGFRPAVWRLARDEGLAGEVFNDGDGVLIRTTGAAGHVSRFLERLVREAPSLARIEQVTSRCLDDVIEFDGFRIVDSVPGENRTRVTPDAAICADCRAEVLNPQERRYRHPFANCTQCGPRFSIVTGVPYDRARTTMSAFSICPECQREYDDPADRRFHAQPIACPSCGPSIWLERLDWVAGSDLRSNAALHAAIDIIERGGILGIRGLGGFHLVCDAANRGAVGWLRSRKRRSGKPFALMAGNLETIRRYCRVTPAEAALLQSVEAPIVLLAADGPEALPEEIAPGLDTLGFMLPYTPLHLLLLQPFDRPLVMTSGNVANEPQITDLDEARTGLRGIADALLMHDRGIANRIDDSVVRIIAGGPRLIRRARGYAPGALMMSAGFETAPDLLAFGGELKAAFCLLKEGAAILSQHQGDLEDVDTFEDYQKNLHLYSTMYDHRPGVLAADLHPEYLSTKLARQSATENSLPLLEIQHHHAHIAGCMAENGVGLNAPPVLGIALDGLGLGDDGTFWGGEFLLADYRGYRRLGRFKPVAMPGGSQAIREPWRSTYAHLKAALGWPKFVADFSGLELFRKLTTKPLATIDRMLERGLNVPPASSCGRLFDAVAAAVGLCADEALFEGQGAMELEAVARRCPGFADEPPYPFTIAQTWDEITQDSGAIAQEPGGLRQLDPSPMWLALLDDLRRQTPVARIAARFHRGLARAVRNMVVRLRDVELPEPTFGTGTLPFDTVALSGGCFQNGLLLEAVSRLLEADGLDCLMHSRVPANDGGLAFGQAVIAAAHLIAHSKQVETSAGAPAQTPPAETRSNRCVLESPARSWKSPTLTGNWRSSTSAVSGGK